MDKTKYSRQIKYDPRWGVEHHRQVYYTCAFTNFLLTAWQQSRLFTIRLPLFFIMTLSWHDHMTGNHLSRSETLTMGLP